MDISRPDPPLMKQSSYLQIPDPHINIFASLVLSEDRQCLNAGAGDVPVFVFWRWPKSRRDIWSQIRLVCLRQV